MKDRYASCILALKAGITMINGAGQMIAYRRGNYYMGLTRSTEHAVREALEEYYSVRQEEYIEDITYIEGRILA